MRKKVILLSILLMFIPILPIKAACLDSEIVSSSKLASNVIFTPIFKEETGKFDIIVSNLNPSFYFTDIRNNRNYKYTRNEIVIGQYTPNESYRFKFYSDNSGCTGDAILSKYVNLPGYNPYYKDPVCKELEDYKFCQKWVNYTYSREKFVEMVNEYKKGVKNPDIETPSKVMGFYDYLLLFYEHYYFIILPIIIIVCVVIIVKRSKKDDFF